MSMLRVLIGFVFCAVVYVVLRPAVNAGVKPPVSKHAVYPDLRTVPVTDGFDFPVGGGSADGYYNAQGFGTNHHLGEDWNGKNGGDSDLGDPVSTIAHGVVVMAGDGGKGWGNVVRVVHNAGSKKRPRYIESLYAHLHVIKVRVGDVIRRGDLVGSIGTANGTYPAHLHLELRSRLKMPVGRGYASETRGYVNPTRFIGRHRPTK